MRSWVLERWGTIDDLVLKQIDEPKPEAGEVLVKISHAGLNFADIIAVRGRYQVKVEPPFVLGSEFAGVVVDANGCTGFEPGDRVLGQVPSGAYAEYCAVDSARPVKLPDHLGFDRAATLPVSYTTAYIALFAKGGLQPGQTVLVHAAAGGLGLAAVQLAKWRGARVISTAGTPEKRALALANGSAAAIDYRQDGWLEEVRNAAPDGVDLVVDPVGGDITLKSIKLLNWGGRLLVCGFAGGAPAAIPANHVLVNAISVVGVFWDFVRDRETVVSAQRELVELAATDRLHLHIDRIVPMAELKSGLEALNNAETSGKVLLGVGL
ncbi:MAG: alcohol dehydrogenase [Parvularcula sp.]|nr:alcohol dehydrogenase [Parvularcula sp.]